MGILLWIVVGVVLGSAARWVMPGPSAGGLAVTLPLGVAGAAVGGFLGGWRAGTASSFDARSVLLAMIGSLLVLFSYRAHALRAMA